jgi:sugar fermentation stimulation protein A
MPGAQVWCQKFDNPARKTNYDLIAVQKGNRLINMDSQAPNTAARQWLLQGGLGQISQLRAEVFHGDSRFDFSFVKDGKVCFLEVKGVTLEQDGLLLFPDAPTQRGVKHLRELAAAVDDTTHCCVLFVAQMKQVHTFAPNRATHPEFADALAQAAKAGVQVLCYDCVVTPKSMELDAPVKVELR